MVTYVCVFSEGGMGAPVSLNIIPLGLWEIQKLL